MKRIIMMLTVALVMAAMIVAMAMPALAAESNFGNCASDEARGFPPGPEKGQDQRLASVYNPHGVNLQCTK